MTVKDKELMNYLAGFFEGEGCVCLSINGKYRNLSIDVSQNDDKPLKLFLDTFGGGRINVRTHKVKNGDTKVGYRFIATIEKTLIAYTEYMKGKAPNRGRHKIHEVKIIDNTTSTILSNFY